MRMAPLMAIALWALLLPSASFGFGLSGATLSARPSTIKAGLFFAGETVTVAGQKPAGEPLLILVIGPQQEQTIAQLVKQQGIWLTGKQQTLTSAPGFLAAAGTDPLPDLFKLFSPAMSRNHLTGISAFFATPEAASADDWHQAYGELLTEDALMIIDPPWVIDEQSGQFSTSVRLPANAPPGRYQVIAFTRGVGQTLTLSSGFELILSGIVSRLATTAYQQPALYGIAALLFALLFGWLIGIIFNRR